MSPRLQNYLKSESKFPWYISAQMWSNSFHSSKQHTADHLQGANDSADDAHLSAAYAIALACMMVNFIRSWTILDHF